MVEVTAAHAVRLVKHSSIESVPKLDPEKWSRFHNVE
jgi:hypothetical protein